MGKARTNVILLDNLTSILGGYVNVFDYLTADQIADVAGNIGTIDVTAEFNQALATGLRVWAPRGTYLVKDELLFQNPGQILQGSGRIVTVIKVTSAFNMAARGVCVSNPFNEGPQLRDLGISFVQPDTAVRANLVAYPPAIYFRHTPRFTLQNIRIGLAMTGIDMTENSGGAFIDTVEIGAFDVGIDIDGSLDTVRLSKVHFWNFGDTDGSFSTNQLAIYRDGTAIGLRVGQMDDLIMNDCLFINRGPQCQFLPGLNGLGCFANISGCDFDTYAKIVVHAGSITFTNCWLSRDNSVANATESVVEYTGGAVKFIACQFAIFNLMTVPMISMNTTSSFPEIGKFQVSDCQFRLSYNIQIVKAQSSAPESHYLTMIGNIIETPADQIPASPLVYVLAGVRVIFIGNNIRDKGANAGTLVKIDVDEQHIVSGNSFVGWGLDVPADQTFAKYTGNIGIPATFVHGFLQDRLGVKLFTGNLNGAGQAVIGYSSPEPFYNVQALQVQGFYNAGANWAPLTLTSIASTAITLSGGSTNLASYRVSVLFSKYQST